MKIIPSIAAVTLFLGAATAENNGVRDLSRRGGVCSKSLDAAFEAIKDTRDKGADGITRYLEQKGLKRRDFREKEDVNKLLCKYQSDRDPNEGCYVLYDPEEDADSDQKFPSSSTYFGTDRRGQASKVLFEKIDEHCECYLAYELGCVAKIPFGEPQEGGAAWSDYVSGPSMSPENYGNFCVFAAVMNGDIDPRDAHLTEDAEMCGCLWVDAVEEIIDDCFGVELGAFDP